MAFELSELLNLVEEKYGISGSAKPLYGDVDLNFHFLSENNEEYVLKLKHNIDEIDNILFQHDMAEHLSNSQLGMPQAVNMKSGSTVSNCNIGGREYLLSMLTWVPGRLWSEQKPHSQDLRKSLGTYLGNMSNALIDYDHVGAHRETKWDNANADWISAELDVFDSEQAQLINYFLEQYLSSKSDRDQLRKSVIHGDANDNNIIIDIETGEPKIKSVIDYGDALYSYTINELANALAYIMMDKRDPTNSVLPVISSYHHQFLVLEHELKLLPLMIATRLMISVTHSSINFRKDPTNAYHQISAQGAWEVLEWLRSADQDLLIAKFRYACGYDPTGKQQVYQKWITKHRQSLRPLVEGFQIEDTVELDLSVDSPMLGHYENYKDVHQLDRVITNHLIKHKADWGTGRYAEVRPIYTTDRFADMGDNGPEWRTVHLGLDVFGPVGTPVCSPLRGVIHSVHDNGMNGDYGTTVIIRHNEEDFMFFTLYGHLYRRDLGLVKPNQQVKAGEVIGHFGAIDENGGWPPHLHFQVILDLFENDQNYPGVFHYDEQEFWKLVCPDPSVWLGLSDEVEGSTTSTNSLLEKRKEVLGRSLSISYQQPLHMVRGRGRYLIDHTGRRYLDMVNNVAHVGHEHPKVVEAGQRQMSLLNTNTRYLHEELIAFAEELTATLPEPLSVCHFVNSGSEANELALRMAKVYSGAKDIIAVKHGYHGNTQECINVSSYKFYSPGGEGKPEHVHLLDIPDVFRGEFRDENAGLNYANQVDNIINALSQQDKSPAALICESILSCGGQVMLTRDYLKQVYNKVRAAGGVCIADEVQVGLGRVGKHYWGFELSEVIPDIVTIGKPLGNGHPVAAVITKPEIADAFNNGMEFFNTFGGNPVSCAIGRSVLNVVESEGLQQHALEMGTRLKKGLVELQSKYPIIGDVRGEGLFLGFELVENLETLAPAAKQASYLANRMRDKGVLLSTDGPLHNVIKIKPPMVIQPADIEMALELLDEVFDETAMEI